jgi:hypothetical protein
MLFGSDRTAMRRVFVEAWTRHMQGLPLDRAQTRIVEIIALHPEWHTLLSDPDSAMRDFDSQGDAANPFLHLALHLSLREQHASDRPAGVARALDALRRVHADQHDAEHDAMQCLAQVLREAQRAAGLPDEARYLACLRERILDRRKHRRFHNARR